MPRAARLGQDGVHGDGGRFLVMTMRLLPPSPTSSSRARSVRRCEEKGVAIYVRGKWREINASWMESIRALCCISRLRSCPLAGEKKKKKGKEMSL